MWPSRGGRHDQGGECSWLSLEATFACRRESGEPRSPSQRPLPAGRICPFTPSRCSVSVSFCPALQRPGCCLLSEISHPSRAGGLSAFRCLAVTVPRGYQIAHVFNIHTLFLSGLGDWLPRAVRSVHGVIVNSHQRRPRRPVWVSTGFSKLLELRGRWL